MSRRNLRFQRSLLIATLALAACVTDQEAEGPKDFDCEAGTPTHGLVYESARREEALIPENGVERIEQTATNQIGPIKINRITRRFFAVYPKVPLPYGVWVPGRTKTPRDTYRLEFTVLGRRFTPSVTLGENYQVTGKEYCKNLAGLIHERER